MAWDRTLCANKRGVTVWLPTLFIFHGTMQMAFKGSMRRKQKGNEQRWVAPRKSLPHIITLDYTLQWRLDAVRRLQSRRRAFRGSVWFEFFFLFFLLNLAVYIPDIPAVRPGTRMLWPFKVWSTQRDDSVWQRRCSRGSSRRKHQGVNGRL